MPTPGRRKYSSRNKFVPWLTVYMRRTEEDDGASGATVTSTVTLSLTLDFNTYEYDMYLDNVIWYARFVESGTQSVAIGGAGGYTYFYNEVFPDATSLTADDMGIWHYTTATPSGVTTIRYIDSTEKKFGTGSLFVDGAGGRPYPDYSYLVFNADRNLTNVYNDLKFTTDTPFTAEWWINIDPSQAYSFISLCSYGHWLDYSNNPPAWALHLDGMDQTSTETRNIFLHMFDSGKTRTYTQAIVFSPYSTWHHIAIVKKEIRHMSVYWNGQRLINCSLSDVPSSIYLQNGDNMDFVVGGDYQGGDPPRVRSFKGLIDEFRFTSNVARYTSASFTLATAQFRFKPWHSGVINHLCNYTLDAGSWGVVDALGHSFNRYGSPGGDPPRADYHTNCIYFDGTGDAIEWSATATADFDFSLGDMTVDIKAVPIGSGSLGDPTPVLLQIGSDSAAQTIRLCLDGNTPANVKLQKGTGGTYTDILSATASISSSERALISVVRRNNVWALFKNGVSFGSATNTFSVSGNIWIGNGSGLANGFYGWVNGTRTIKNGCQYVQDFSPAPRAFNYRDWSIE